MVQDRADFRWRQGTGWAILAVSGYGHGGRMPRWPAKQDRKQLVNEIDVKGMIENASPELIDRLAKHAWGQATGIREMSRAMMDGTYRKFAFRKKQRALVEFMAGLISAQEFQVRLTAWALENPGDFFKMFLTTVPKEAEITVNHEGGVVLLVPKMNSIEEWQKEIAEKKDQDVIDVTPTDTV